MTEFHTSRGSTIRGSCVTSSREDAPAVSYGRAGGVVAACFMLYVYQHFRCIDLVFQLETSRQTNRGASLNSSLKLEIAGLRNPMRIDVIARRQLGLTSRCQRRCRNMRLGRRQVRGTFRAAESRTVAFFRRTRFDNQFAVKQMIFQRSACLLISPCRKTCPRRCSLPHSSEFRAQSQSVI